jgi:hypothetical protein
MLLRHHHRSYRGELLKYESPTFPQVKALLSAAYVFLVAGIIKPIIELRQKLWRRNGTITGLQTYCNSQMLREFLMCVEVLLRT